MYDEYNDDDEQGRRRRLEEEQPQQSDPDWNGGIAPAPPSGRYDYNAGSPVNSPNEPLQGGHGWEWEGPQEQSWNPELGQWDRGVWQQREGRGLGYTPPAPPPPPRPPQPPTGGGGQPTFQAPQAAPAAAGPPPAIKAPGITDDVTRILQARLKELSNPSDVASDPIFKQAFRAYQVDQLRGADRQRKQLAERQAATGGTTSSGGFNVGVRGIQERAGENTARYKSGLTLDRLQSREQQLNQAIAAARSVGQDDIANQLELQRLQLQQELGRGDLALRSELGRGQLGLGQDTLGFNYANMVQNANRNAVLAGLGG